MKIEVSVYIEKLKNTVNRTIEVSDIMSLQNFCESIIVCMGGDCKKSYNFRKSDEEIYFAPYLDEDDSEWNTKNVTIKDLSLKENEEYTLYYDYDKGWLFEIIVNKITNEQITQDFKVIDGKGNGIIETLKYSFDLNDLLAPNEHGAYIREYYSKRKWFQNYMNDRFDVDKINNKIDAYFIEKEESIKPKAFEMMVSLEGFTKEIKRKIVVNNNVSIESFCKAVILSMRGELDHAFGMIINGEYISEEIGETEFLTFLNLKEKQKLQVVYDFGDNWKFNIRVSKVRNEYAPKDFTILSGNGYGIIEDCGGIWNLSDIFNGIDKSWGKYNIEDFDINALNKEIDKYM